MSRVKASLVGLVMVLLVFGVGQAREDLSVGEREAITSVTFSMDRLGMFASDGKEPGLFLVVGDGFGKVNVDRLNGRSDHRRVWASRRLQGNPQEVIVVDLDNDGRKDHIVCRTPNTLYAFDVHKGFAMAFESSSTMLKNITAFTTANVDGDPQQEIVLIADGRIHYVDGSRFNQEWTSTENYKAVAIRAGDVDGDRRVELVLGSGHVLDSRSGNLEWVVQGLGPRLELLDFDGDGIPEILSESLGGTLRVWDADFRSEKRFQ